MNQLPAKYMFLVVVIAALVFNGCSESNPVDHDDDHARGVGIKITQSGATVVSYKYDEPVVGALTAKVGELSPAYDFQLIDEDGDAYTPSTDHHELRWEIANTSIAELWQHEGEEGGFEFHVRGLAAGSTTVVFKVYHEGHADFVSKAVPINITN